MLSIGKIAFHALKVFILFTGCTILFYYGMMWLKEEYQNYHRYDEPKGTVMKVSGNPTEEEADWLDRLVLFYMNGE